METGMRNPANSAADTDKQLTVAGEFFLERAEKEHDCAERKRNATLTKATAMGTLAAALATIVAAPTFDIAGLADDAGRWPLLAAVVAFLLAIGCVAKTVLIHAIPGDRVNRHELDNWTSEEYWLTDVVIHSFELTQAFVVATKGLRDANDEAEHWMSRTNYLVAAGLLLMLVAFGIETL
jgi:hypothetical protein